MAATGTQVRCSGQCSRTVLLEGPDHSPGIGEDGCHRLRYTYDDHSGNIVRIDCLDQDGQLAFANGAVYAVWEIHYDDKEGRATEYTFYDKDRKPAAGPGGAFRIAVDYDADDNMTAVAYFSADRQKIDGVLGFHKQISTFEDGREVRTEYFGVDGKLVELGGGYATIERKFDARGNEEQTTYLDAKKHPVRNKDEGFAVKRASFDACRRVTESRYLDEHEKPIRLDRGYAVIKKVYDEGNNLVEEAYLVEREQRIRSIEGYALVKREFDRHRNIIEELYFDEHGEALLIKGKYAKLTRRYDDHNAQVEEAYFGANEELVLNEEGWARITYVKNADGQDIEIAYFGTNGKPLKLKKATLK